MERAEVVRGAVRQFQADGSLDMDLLATQLAVSRATLYRIVGSRDALLGDALWWLARRTLDRVRRAREMPGADGVIEVSRRFADRLWAARPISRFVAAEPRTAARVLFTADGRVHRRAVAAQREIFLEAGVDLRAEAMERAFLYVRIMESVLYGELIGGRRVEFPVAEKALRALLTA
ncbi:QsdR family transcriptional regulator [Actinoplanes sp. CA-030573]|uniref:QsdR family transcriptional regulator n=1 Tax=Actinoplanes sp. CA-030573 TaxID=3239898 RepID=UPI003D8D2810